MHKGRKKNPCNILVGGPPKQDNLTWLGWSPHLGLLSLPFLGKIRMILFALSTANLAIKSCSWLTRAEVLLTITTIILVNESTTVTHLAIRSCSWLTRKDGGRAATPPCGMVISSLMVMIVVLILGPAIFGNLPISSQPAYRTTKTKGSSFCGHDSRETLRQKSHQHYCYCRSTSEQI